MNILAFNGSPRRAGNTTHLVREFLRGALEAGARAEELVAEELNLKYCRGCLRCNMLKRCVIKGDDWPAVSSRILAADVLVFASPIYFHHLTAPLKKLLDRFRSFIHVQVTEEGLRHTPWQTWQKHFVLLLSLGSSKDDDAQPVLDLFNFLTDVLVPATAVSTVIGTRLAVVKQVTMEPELLRALYPKIGLPESLAEGDYHRNRALLQKCYELGRELATAGRHKQGE
jgi:putative NADPH-quinone reductase